MRRIVFGALLALITALPAAAQVSQQPPTKDPLATWLRNSYGSNRKFLAGAAEKMPDEFYGLRPGAQLEVRTFGQIVGHEELELFRKHDWLSASLGSTILRAETAAIAATAITMSQSSR